jgi:ribokinase
VSHQRGHDALRPTVYVLGEIMIDIMVLVPHDPEPATDTPSIIREHQGGSGANVAAWLASLEMPVAMIARVGDDRLGHDAIAELLGRGVRSYVGVDSLLPTGRCVILVSPDGERTMMPDRGANAGLMNLPEVPWHRGDHLHVSGYLILAEDTRPAALQALHDADISGLSTSVDVSSAGPLRRVGAEAFREWTSRADVILANREEAAVLTGMDDAARSARQLLAPGPPDRIAIVKTGSDGASAAWKDQAVSVSAPAIEAIDSTGAGDAFAAGFLASWLSGANPDEAMRHAVTIGSRAAAQTGGRP